MMSWDLQLSEMKGIKRNPLALGKASNTQSTTQLGNSKATDPATQLKHFRIVCILPAQERKGGGGGGGRARDRFLTKELEY